MMLAVVCVGVFSLSLWLQVSLDKGDRKDRDLHEDLWFELSDETLCNWMMFVRPAQNHLEQNLVAYQYGHHVYYTTIKNVEPKQTAADLRYDLSGRPSKGTGGLVINKGKKYLER